MSAKRSEQPDDLDVAAEVAIAACDGDARAAVRALIVANDFLIEQVDTLSRELDFAWKWISPGYTRKTNRRRMRSGDPD